MSATATDRHAEPETYGRRPWGSWQVLDVGVGYKAKRLTVEPHCRLSLQWHEHRSEHWFVIAGTATCTVGEHERLAGPGAHVVVPRRAVHRIANEGSDDLVIMEIQIGPYTGEDDIVRLQDDYGRG